jgi:predicted ester cyclase
MATASRNELTDLMKEFFRRAYDENDPTVFEDLLAPDMLTHGLTPEPLRKAADFKKWYMPFRAAFSDVHCKVVHAMVEGEWITVRLEFTGRHTGDHLGPKASGKDVKLSAIVQARWVNGKAVEGYNEFNQLALLQQIGAA